MLYGAYELVALTGAGIGLATIQGVAFRSLRTSQAASGNPGRPLPYTLAGKYTDRFASWPF
jgi:hypothetical protein